MFVYYFSALLSQTFKVIELSFLQKCPWLKKSREFAYFLKIGNTSFDVRKNTRLRPSTSALLSMNILSL